MTATVPINTNKASHYLNVSEVHPHMELLQHPGQFAVVGNRPVDVSIHLLVDVEEVTKQNWIIHQLLCWPSHLEKNLNQILKQHIYSMYAHTEIKYITNDANNTKEKK